MLEVLDDSCWFFGLSPAGCHLYLKGKVVSKKRFLHEVGAVAPEELKVQAPARRQTACILSAGLAQCSDYLSYGS